jgi:hypothetical protein
LGEELTKLLDESAQISFEDRILGFEANVEKLLVNGVLEKSFAF